MKMKWEGTAQFKAKNKAMAERIRVASARVCMESAKEQRDRALEGFNIYSIRMVTGRSRALYAAAPGEGMLTPGATKVTYEAGYISWPKHDHFSGADEIPLYPYWLNFGNNQMPSRPFHTRAVEYVRPKFRRRIRQVMKEETQRK